MEISPTHPGISLLPNPISDNMEVVGRGAATNGPACSCFVVLSLTNQVDVMNASIGRTRDRYLIVHTPTHPPTHTHTHQQQDEGMQAIWGDLPLGCGCRTCSYGVAEFIDCQWITSLAACNTSPLGRTQVPHTRTRGSLRSMQSVNLVLNTNQS